MSGYSRQTWTAFVSAAVFVALAAVLALVPVPFVTWTPGTSHDVLGAAGDKPVIAIRGAETFPTEGRLDLTTLSVTRADSHLSLPEALVAYWMPSRDALPRSSVYRPGSTAEEVEVHELRLMADSKSSAVVAALRQADVPVRELPQVTSVTIGSPAQAELQPGDLIRRVDGRRVRTVQDVQERIRNHRVGENVSFQILRGKAPQTVSVGTVASNQDAREPVIGITMGRGFDYAPDVQFSIDPEIGGPSAGLAFALGVYDKLTPGSLIGNRTVAATGTITAEGQVGPIGGVKQKLKSAEASGATVFVVPRSNCSDLSGVETSVTVVQVDTIGDAVRALGHVTDPARADQIDRCPT